MTVSMTNALAAYARQAKDTGGGMEPRSADPGKSFADMLGESLESAVKAGKESEQMSAKAIAGQADLNEVVSAVSNAEVTLQTVVAIRDRVYDKMLSQVAQARARGAMVVAVATEGDAHIADKADHVLYVPDAPELLTPVLTVIPLQLLAYHVAVLRGCDVDQPRNLAKSVTVE